MSENYEKIHETQRVTILERLIFEKRASDSWRVDARRCNYLFNRAETSFLYAEKRNRGRCSIVPWHMHCVINPKFRPGSPVDNTVHAEPRKSLNSRRSGPLEGWKDLAAKLTSLLEPTRTLTFPRATSRSQVACIPIFVSFSLSLSLSSLSFFSLFGRQLLEITSDSEKSFDRKRVSLAWRRRVLADLTNWEIQRFHKLESFVCNRIFIIKTVNFCFGIHIKRYL